MEVQNSTLTRKKQIYKIANSSGLTFSILENGTIKSIRNSNVRINLVEAGLLQKSFCNLYLRKRNKGGKISAVPLLGSAGPSEIKISDNIFQTKGCFDRVSYCCELVLSQNNNCWFWNIQLENTSDQTTVLDVIYVQDVGLSAVKGETNQAYVSQYVDFTSLVDDKYGNILCCRQNEHGPDCTPWLGLGAVSGIESFSTDGLSLFGKPYRQTGIPQFLTQSKLTGLRQKELAVVALQHKPFTLKPSQQKEIDFFAVYCKDHPEPASFSDLNIIDEQVRAFSGKIEFNGVESVEPVRDLFSQSPFFQAENLTEKQINKLFPGKRFSEEFYEDKLLSFFRQDGKHIVLKDKELLVCRPHANIVRTGSGLIPDERIMSCTGYMYGVFISQLTQGNVDFNRFLSGSYDSLNFNRSSGQRIFIKRGDKYCQLGLPSAFEMSYNSCRWIYKNDKSLFELIITASQEIPQISLELNVIEGEPVQLFISNNLTEENKWQHGYIKDTRFEIKSIDFYPSCDTQSGQMYPDGYFNIEFENSESVNRTGTDELLFDDKKSRGESYFTVESKRVNNFKMFINGCLTEQKNKPTHISNDSYSKIKVTSECMGLDEIFTSFGWYIHNAQIHYLVPHGIEQYSGGAWGTRDICQGPLEMLLGLGYFKEARKVLTIIFSNQNTDGNWDQWWMFDKYNFVRAGESHGDVIFWPILALCEYIKASGDYGILTEQLPYYDDKANKKDCAYDTLINHIFKAVAYVRDNRFAQRTHLVDYSNGDWNDSMQPVNSELKNRLISSWTVELSYQTFNELSKVCYNCGYFEKADELKNLCSCIHSHFMDFLVKDSIVAGFGIVNNEGNVDLLMHPLHPVMEIKYRLLPMVRGIISGIFEPQQAKIQVEIIEKYLKAPDGARLADRPPRYSGGICKYFKRAESCPFFGREIGLMYTHAHLRYAEALAKMGYADTFIKALRQAVPVNIQQLVPQADIRQSNCYYSSSDADFVNRYQADEDYEDLVSGRIKLNGGWRVYSSGPGMFVRFIISYLLGIRFEYGKVVFDPVLTEQQDGLNVKTMLFNRELNIKYRIKSGGKEVSKVVVNGLNLPFDREPNPYRRGGAMVDKSNLESALNRKENRVEIIISRYEQTKIEK